MDKFLVYQYWNGKTLPGPTASKNNIKEYCDRIGVDHIFDVNPHWGKSKFNLLSQPLHYDCFKPVFEPSYYEKYDYILFLDADIFAVDNLKENIFNDFIESECEISMSVEVGRAEQRMLNLKKNNSHLSENRFEYIVKSMGGVLPKDDKGYNKVYNSGVVLYSNHGMEKVRNNFMSPREYQRMAMEQGLKGLYLTDQNYLHAMVFSNDIKFYELSSDWNVIMRMRPDKKKTEDLRTKNSKFIHIQYQAADHRNEKFHWDITNLPQEKWGEECKSYFKL